MVRVATSRNANAATCYRPQASYGIADRVVHQNARRTVLVRFESERNRTASPFTIKEVTLRTGLVDYYKMLDLEKTANLMEIKASYRQLQKKCHPDILGDEQGHEMSILLNDAYTVLSNEITRELYDIDLHGSRMEEELGFTNETFSNWLPASDPAKARNTNPGETRALFVDEASCIGCKQCCFAANDTFVLDSRYGRARVDNQWADHEENLNLAVETCPVRCIHWVQREDLPVLEHVMKHTTRIDVGIMQSATAGKGSQTDVFVMADSFRAKKRERRKARKSWTEKFMYSREQEAAMRRAAGEHGPAGFVGSFGGLQMLMPWVRARLWEIFGYGMERQPAVERKPRTWTPPAEAGYRGGSIAGAVDESAPPPKPSATLNASAEPSSIDEPVDCGRAHILTPEEKEIISAHVDGEKNVPESKDPSKEGSDKVRRR